MIVLEACVDSAAAALAAAGAGAHRVELCANLVEGGTTPSIGAVHTVVARAEAGVMVMIRPRGGDFAYSPGELETMRRDIEAAASAGATGVVFGCLTPRGDIDREAAASLLEAARPLEVTFHRAFDVCRDPMEALEVLVDLGVDRLLTSGQRPTALEGLGLIRELVAAAGDRIIVMPGVGIGVDNVRRVAVATAARELHVYTERARPSAMEFRRPDIPMGKPYVPDEYVRIEPDTEELEVIAAALRRLSPR